MPYSNGIDRRIHLRNVSLNRIQFCFAHDPPAKMHMGATINISHSGLCVVTSDHLRQDECIIIKNDLSLLSQKATVRWVKSYQQNFCKAGLMFIDNPP
jgi:hypothetical protein